MEHYRGNAGMRTDNKQPNKPETEYQKFWTRKTQIHLMEPRKQKREC